MSEEMTREEMFKKAVEERKKQAEKKKQLDEARKNGGKDYEDIKWTGIPKAGDGIALVRLLGKPLGVNIPKDEYDPVMVLTADIYDDDGKFRRFIIPPKDEEPNHPYWQVINKVLACNWVNDKPEYTQETKHPEIFKKVRWNGKDSKVRSPYEQGWKFSRAIIQNCIDYVDYKWHTDNNHTALLSNYVSVDDDGNTKFVKYGFTSSLDSLIFNNIVQYEGDYENYQIAIKKTGDNQNPYQVFHGPSDARKIQTEDSFVAELLEDRLMDKNESSWEKYNLQKLFKVSSYSKWFSKLGIFFQQFDKAYKTNTYEYLKEKAEEEKAQYESENKEKEAVKVEEPKLEIREEAVNEEVAPTQAPTPTRRRSAKVEEPKEDVFQLESYSDVYPFISSLTTEDKKLIIGYDAAYEYNGVGTYKDDMGIFIFEQGGELIPCEECGFPFDSRILTCPKCGKSYK